ncbi:ABC transporter permease [Acuticoccus sp.]|uniref:ABC transporter permease n=1 Tax=Acuticoccus sp. TaxID=1904378 RepID=UPI003B5157D1
MLNYVVRRVLYVLPIVFGVTVLVFALVHLAPGDPLNAVVSPDAPAEAVERLKAQYGFDRPLPVQYAYWVGNVLTGDLGVSVATGRPIAPQIGTAVVNTLILAVGATLLGFTLGAVLGGIAGAFQGSWIDKVVTAIAVTGVSVPHYWLGIVLVIIFAVELNTLPAMGMGPGGSSGWAWDVEHLRHLVLPVVTLSVIPMGIIARTIRAAVAEVLSQEFIQGLRARGLRTPGVMMHVVGNVAATALAVMGLQLGYLLGGSILVETVFAWPGTGFLLNDAIFKRDIPLLQSTILVLALFFVALNLVVDLAQVLLDPRMRRG